MFLLAVAVKAASPLHQASRIPGQVVIDHNVTVFVQVETLSAGFRRNHKLRRRIEKVNVLALCQQVHTTVDLRHATVGVVLGQLFDQIILGGAVFGEYQQFEALTLERSDDFRKKLFQFVVVRLYGCRRRQQAGNLQLFVVKERCGGDVNNVVQVVQAVAAFHKGIFIQVVAKRQADVGNTDALQTSQSAAQGLVDGGDAGGGQLAVDGHYEADSAPGIAAAGRRVVTVPDIVSQFGIKVPGGVGERDFNPAGVLPPEQKLAVRVRNLAFAVPQDDFRHYGRVGKQGSKPPPQIGAQETQQIDKPFVVALMRRSSQKYELIRQPTQLLRQAIALGNCFARYFAQVVGFVKDDHIPRLGAGCGEQGQMAL